MEQISLPHQLNPNFKVFNHNYGIPCLVTATTREGFEGILRDRKILTSQKTLPGKSKPWTLGKIDRLMELEDVSWFKMGFPYNSMKKDEVPFGIIFDLSILNQNWRVFEIDLIHHLYKKILRSWISNNQNIIQEFCDNSEDHRKAVQIFIETDQNEKFYNKGSRSGYFNYWEFHREIDYLFEKTPGKLGLIDLLLQEKESLTVLSQVEDFLRDEYLQAKDRGAEMVCHQDIELNDKRLHGFYIQDFFRSSSKWNEGEIFTLIENFLKGTDNVKEDQLVIFDGHSKIKWNEFIN